MKHRVFSFLKPVGALILHLLFLFTMVSLSLPFVFGLLFGRIRSRRGRACMAAIYALTSLAYSVMVMDAVKAFEGTSFLQSAPSSKDALFALSFEMASFAIGMTIAAVLRRMKGTRLPGLAWLPITEKHVLQLAVCLIIAAVADRCDIAGRDPQVAMVTIGRQLNEASPEQVAEFNEAFRGFLNGVNKEARR